MQKIEEAEAKFLASQSQKLEELDLEKYLENEGYTWNYKNLTCALLMNFLTVKGVRTKSNMNRNDLVLLAKDFVKLNPIPKSMSVSYDDVNHLFFENAMVARHQETEIPALLPELVSAEEHPYDYNQVTTRNDQGKLVVQMELTRSNGTVRLSPDFNISNVALFHSVNNNIVFPILHPMRSNSGGSLMNRNSLTNSKNS
jgi:hypothetical protein